jgi:hypothetical protein
VIKEYIKYIEKPLTKVRNDLLIKLNERHDYHHIEGMWNKQEVEG